MLCQPPSLGVSPDLWALQQGRIWCWSSCHGFWCSFHFNLCPPVCSQLHLIPSAAGEMCPASSPQLPCLYQSHFITGKSQLSHRAAAPKSCLQSSAVGHHLHFLTVSNKSAQFTCQSDSSSPCASRKCPGTSSGRTNHFGFGSVIISSCNEIPRTSCCSCQTHPQPLSSGRIAQLQLQAQARWGVHHPIAIPGREGGIALHTCRVEVKTLKTTSGFSPPTEQT